MDEVEALKENIKDLRKLQEVANDEAFKTYFDNQIKIVAMLMESAFTTDRIKTLEDFYKVKGEVIARLQPIQEVYSAESIIAHQVETLSRNYQKQI